MSLILTRLQNMRSNSPVDRKEIRASRYGALAAFMAQSNSPTGIVNDDLKNKAGISDGSTLEYPVIDDNTALTIGSTRDVVIVDAENTSRMIVVSFTTYAHGFTIVPAQHHNNEVAMQRDFETKMKLTDRLFNSAINGGCIAKLESDKSKVYNETLLYTELADVIVASYAQREDILGDLNVMMGANDFYGQLHVVANPGFESLVKDLREQRADNARNKDEEHNDKLWFWDRAVVNGAGKYATAYAIEEDSLGILFRHEVEAIYGRRMQDGTEWGIGSLPMSGVPVSTYYYESKGDFSAIQSGAPGGASAHLNRVMKQHYGFAIDVGLVTAYISDRDNRPSPIMKVNINTSTTDSDATAPTLAFTSSADLTNVVVTASEIICTDEAGTIATGDIKDLFTLTVATPGASITSATVAADGRTITFVIDDTNLAAGDDIAIDANSLYDGNGNAVVGASIIDVNGGGTAWEAV